MRYRQHFRLELHAIAEVAKAAKAVATRIERSKKSIGGIEGFACRLIE